MIPPHTGTLINELSDNGRKRTFSLSQLKKILQLHELEVRVECRVETLEQFDFLLQRDEIRDWLQQRIDADRKEIYIITHPPIRM